MEEPARPQSPKTSRTSKFSQTLSRFRGIIRLPSSFKSTNNHLANDGRLTRAQDDKLNRHPYPFSQRRSTMGGDMVGKPYMSQPMLGLSQANTPVKRGQQPGYEFDQEERDSSEMEMSESSASPTTDRDHSLPPPSSASRSDFPLPSDAGKRTSIHARVHDRDNNTLRTDRMDNTLLPDSNHKLKRRSRSMQSLTRPASPSNHQHHSTPPAAMADSLDQPFASTFAPEDANIVGAPSFTDITGSSTKPEHHLPPALSLPLSHLQGAASTSNSAIYSSSGVYDTKSNAAPLPRSLPSPTSPLSPTPPTPPPKSPAKSLKYKRRFSANGRTGREQTNGDASSSSSSSPPPPMPVITRTTSNSSGKSNAGPMPASSNVVVSTPSKSSFKSFTKALVRRASSSRLRSSSRASHSQPRRAEAEPPPPVPPVPPLPSVQQAARQDRPQSQTRLESSLEASTSMSTSVSISTTTSSESTATVTPSKNGRDTSATSNVVHSSSALSDRPTPISYGSTPAVATLTTIVIANPSLSSSSASSFRTAASSLSSQPGVISSAAEPEATSKAAPTLHLETIIIPRRAASTNDAEILSAALAEDASAAALSANNTDKGNETPKAQKPPRISLPGRRLSALSARLSPSLVLRPPPLPILNLPRLPPELPSPSLDSSGLPAPPGRGGDVSRRGRAGLGSMPALPLQGRTRGVGGHEEEEVGDDDEDDEDADTDDDDDMADEEDGQEHDEHDDDHEEEEDGMMRPETSLSMSSDSGSGLSGAGEGRSSYDVPRDGGHGPANFGGMLPPFGAFDFMGGQRRLQQQQQYRSPGLSLLPPLNVSSPFDIWFHASPSSASPSAAIPASSGMKGKEKQLPPPPSPSIYDVTASQPTVAIPSPQQFPSSTSSHSESYDNGYFSLPTNDQPHHLSASLLHQSFVLESNNGYDRTPSPTISRLSSRTSGHLPSSPLHTPRPEDYVPHPQRLMASIPSEKVASLPSNRYSSTGGDGGLLVQRPSMYKHASRSLIDIHGMDTRAEVKRMVREDEEQQEKKMHRKSLRRKRESIVAANAALPSQGLERPQPRDFHSNAIRDRSKVEGAQDETETSPKTEGSVDIAGGATIAAVAQTRTPSATNAGLGTSSGLSTSATEASDLAEQTGNLDAVETKKQNRLSSAPAYDDIPHPLRRRRSMPMFNETTAPPPYPSFAPHPFASRANHLIMPREDEGKEKLPAYSNSISLRAIMPRKMEFIQPGVQAKDRKWRRVMCVLEGTMLRVYKCPAGPGGVSAIGQWWESKVGAGDVAAQAAASGSATTAAGAARMSVAAVHTSERNIAEEKAKHQYIGLAAEFGADFLPRRRSSSRRNDPHSASQPLVPSRPPPLQMNEEQHQHRQYQANQTQLAITKSALNLAVQFLKPGSRHGRSNSDITPPSPTTMARQTPRSSLTLPRSGTTTPTSAPISANESRFHSPLPSSSSSLVAQAHGSESRAHSPIPSSSNLTIPSSSSNASSSMPSRPVTPTTGGSLNSRSSRFRAGVGSTVPRTPNSGSSFGSTGKGKEVAEIPEPNPNDLIQVYSMQNAESGLGNDYIKRKNVIRVRLQGEQFLLQAKDVPSVVEWIEGLQAATNVALDLDVRPMPRGPIFPRRRRRRRPVPPIATNSPTPAPLQTHRLSTQESESYTPTSATAGQPALRRNQ